MKLMIAALFVVFSAVCTAQTPPESMQSTFGHESVQQQARSAAITITEDTIIPSDPYAGSTLSSYKVIGGNARLVVVESVDEEGIESVVNIRLVDTGIAIETTDCRRYPEECARQQRRAMVGMKKRMEDTSTHAFSTAADGATITPCPDDGCLDGIVEPQFPADQPR